MNFGASTTRSVNPLHEYSEEFKAQPLKITGRNCEQIQEVVMATPAIYWLIGIC
jgi:hypothetical protein